MGVRHFKDLIAWQLGEQFHAQVRAAVGRCEAVQHDHRYRSQLLDASSAVPSDIAEGFLRCSPGDFRRFLDYALGSLVEAEGRLRDGIERGYFTALECDPVFRLGKRCLTAMVRLKQSQRRPDRGRPGDSGRKK
jgi:four helix bundle protein